MKKEKVIKQIGNMVLYNDSLKIFGNKKICTFKVMGVTNLDFPQRNSAKVIFDKGNSWNRVCESIQEFVFDRSKCSVYI